MGSGATIGAGEVDAATAGAAGMGAGDRLSVEGLIGGGDWVFGRVAASALSADGGSCCCCARGGPPVGGGVTGRPGSLCVETSAELMLDSSLAWVSPKRRVSDLPSSEPDACGGRLMCPVL